MNLLAPVFAATSARAQSSVNEAIIVASGPVGGAYYRLAGQLCEALNGFPTQMPCLVLPSRGTEDNLAHLKSGRANFAILQSDWIYRAARGEISDLAPMDTLKSVAALDGRIVTLMVGPESKISKASDLKGKRVSFGPEGSGLAFGGEALMAALDWTVEDFKALVSYSLEALPSALCEGRIDAFILPLLHPESVVREALAACEARIVGLNGGDIEDALIGWPFMSSFLLDPALYQRLDYKVQSFGLVSTLATRAGVEDEMVGAVTRAALARFKIAKEVAPNGGVAAHKGAALVLSEAGVIVKVQSEPVAE